MQLVVGSGLFQLNRGSWQQHLKAVNYFDGS